MIGFLSKILLFLVVPFSIGTNSILRHPFHVSTTEINYNAAKKSLEITCRIFSDDFEDILYKQFKGKIDLHDQNKLKENDQLIFKYLQYKMLFNIDGKNYSPTYIGFENDYEATNVYLEISKINNFKRAVVNNAILYDLFNDQINLIHFVKNGKRISNKVAYPDKQMIFNFK